MPPAEKPAVHHYTAVLHIHARDIQPVKATRPPYGDQEATTTLLEPREVARIVVRGEVLEVLLEKVKSHLDLVED